MLNAIIRPGGRCLQRILPWLLLSCLISMTGCSHYVVVPGGETIQVNIQQWDQLRQDNELCMQELARLKGGNRE